MSEQARKIQIPNPQRTNVIKSKRILFHNKKDIQFNDESYVRTEALLQRKLIDIIENYEIAKNDSEDTTDCTRLRAELDFFLSKIKEHQTNSLLKQHINMREKFSTSAKSFFKGYLIVIFIFTGAHILGMWLLDKEFLSMPVLVVMLGTVPINFIGLFNIILKDLFPKGSLADFVTHAFQIVNNEKQE